MPGGDVSLTPHNLGFDDGIVRGLVIKTGSMTGRTTGTHARNPSVGASTQGKNRQSGPDQIPLEARSGGRRTWRSDVSAPGGGAASEVSVECKRPVGVWGGGSRTPGRRSRPKDRRLRAASGAAPRGTPQCHPASSDPTTHTHTPKCPPHTPTKTARTRFGWKRVRGGDMEPIGIEPTTSSMRPRRSPN